MSDKVIMTREEYVINSLAVNCGKDIEYMGKNMRSLNCYDAQMMIFLIVKRLEEKGIKLTIPFYWGTHGARLELNTLVEMYPNINWTCLREEFESCPYKLDCDFKGKYRGEFTFKDPEADDGSDD